MPLLQPHGVQIRDGHADAEICGSCGLCSYHYPHINICQKWQFLGQKWVSLALISILSAQNIIVAHPTWFNPSSEIKNKSQESQYFGNKI